MSLDIRYLTNGEISVYTVRNSGVTPMSFDIYKCIEDVPESIRCGLPIGEPVMCHPDLARCLGVLDLFYPGHGNCGRPDLKPHNVKKCIAEQCRYASNGRWKDCKYYGD